MINNNDPKIKIYVVCHKPSYVPENPYLYPIQVGAAINGRHLPGMLHDDEGDNISDKNKSYCELTAHYWAWKNEDADYYGFFHYRRYFSFDPDIDRDDGYGNIAFDKINEDTIREIKLNPADMRAVIEGTDVICVKGRTFPRIEQPDGKLLNVYHDYGKASFQHKNDLDITLQVLKEKYPEFIDIADKYMDSTITYECNMFIMRREIFHDYCSWLFDILFEAEKRIDMTWYSVEEYRVMGYLAERLTGLYYTYLKNKDGIKWKELPKTLFVDTEPKDKILKPTFKDEVPIVLSANNKFAPYLDIMIRSVIANSSKDRNYDLIVLYNDISEQNRNWISNAAADRDNISIRFIKVSEYFDEDNLFIDQHLSVETYYRLIIPDIMPDFHKILYLDCDIVVDRDVAELYDIELGDAVIGAMKDIDVAGQVNLKKNDWDQYAVETLGLDNAHDYFQAGVLSINLDKLKTITSCEEMISLALSQSFRCHDQDVLNIICKNKVKYLPQQWNVLMDWREKYTSRMQIMKMAQRDLYNEYMQARKEPYIIHFAGYQKPWDTVDCDLADYFWKYASLSPYYPRVLKSWNRCLETEVESPKYDDNSGIRKVANKLLPYGSRRREFVKSIVNKKGN